MASARLGWAGLADTRRVCKQAARGVALVRRPLALNHASRPARCLSLRHSAAVNLRALAAQRPSFVSPRQRALIFNFRPAAVGKHGKNFALDSSYFSPFFQC